MNPEKIPSKGIIVLSDSAGSRKKSP